MSTAPSVDRDALLAIDWDDNGRVLMVTLLVGDGVGIAASGERGGSAGLGDTCVGSRAVRPESERTP